MENINFSNFHRQHFSFQTPLMSYIIFDPSSTNGHLKLLKSCKYFYIKNPVVSVDRLEWDCKENCWISYGHQNSVIKLDLNSYKILSVNRLSIHNCHSKIPNEAKNIPQNAVSQMLQRLYFCTPTDLCIFNQNLTYNEYKELTKFGTISHFSMTVVVIQYEDGKIVPFEKIMERLPLVKHLNFSEFFAAVAPSAFTRETFQNLTALPEFQQLSRCSLRGQFGVDDSEQIINFIHKHGHHCYFKLKFPRLNAPMDWVLILREIFNMENGVLVRKRFHATRQEIFVLPARKLLEKDAINRCETQKI